MRPKQVPVADWMGEAIKKALDQLKDDGVFEEYIRDAFGKVIVKDFKGSQYSDLEKEISELKRENNDLRLRLMDAVISSDNKPCNCNPCVVRETIVEDILFRK